MSKATFPVSTVLTKFTFAPTASGVYANASTKLLHANYDQSSPEEVVSILWTHLSSDNKKNKLLYLSSQFCRLFSGTLGRYVQKKFSIQL